MTGENSIALADWSRFIADCRTPGVEALDPWERSARSCRLAAEQRELDRERARERRRRYRLRHPDRVRESDWRYRESHRDQRAEYMRAWQKRNPEKNRESSRRYRGRLKERKMNGQQGEGRDDPEMA